MVVVDTSNDLNNLGKQGKTRSTIVKIKKNDTILYRLLVYNLDGKDVEDCKLLIYEAPRSIGRALSATIIVALYLSGQFLIRYIPINCRTGTTTYNNSWTVNTISIPDLSFHYITEAIKCLGYCLKNNNTKIYSEFDGEFDVEIDIIDLLALPVILWPRIRLVVIEADKIKVDIEIRRNLYIVSEDYFDEFVIPEEDGDYLDIARNSLLGKENNERGLLIIYADTATTELSLLRYITRCSEAEKVYIVKPSKHHSVDNVFKLKTEELSMFPEHITGVIRKYIVRPYIENLYFKPRNIVFIGPPGIGKTTLSKAIIRELGYDSYILVTSASYRSKWYGESETHLENLIKQAEDMNIPLIFDNAEFVGTRDIMVNSSGDVGIVSEVSVLLNWLERNTVPIHLIYNSITNIDKALLRHGRIDLIIAMLYPDKEWRRIALNNLEKKYHIKLPHNVKKLILKKSEYASIAELEACIKLYILSRSVDEALSVFRNIDVNKRRQEEIEILNQVKSIQNLVLVLPREKDKLIREKLSVIT